MPELPDVEVYRRYFARHALRQRIERVHVTVPELLDGTTPQGLGRALKGAAFESAHRHGKYLFAELDRGGGLALHFGMTGRLAYVGPAEPTPDYTACAFTFANAFELAYASQRKLGRIALADSLEDFVAEHELGPDVLGLDAEEFSRLASGRSGTVKSWLMNQAVMAGIGNVYSDEALFQAGIHPRRKLAELDRTLLRRLHGTLRRVLEAAVKAGADPGRMPPSFLLPRRVRGSRCPRCGGPVERTKVGVRTAWYCPTCQPEC